MQYSQNIFLLAACLFLYTSAYCKKYYVNAIHGNNINNGLSASSPLKTMLKVSNTLFNTGDIISFKADQRFHGKLDIRLSGKIISGNATNDFIAIKFQKGLN